MFAEYQLGGGIRNCTGGARKKTRKEAASGIRLEIWRQLKGLGPAFWPKIDSRSSRS